MTRTLKHCSALIALSTLATGCITHHSVVYKDVERVPVEFESDAAARLFYETLSRDNSRDKNSESTTTICIPIIFENQQKTVAGPSVKFNRAVSECDTNKDGQITEMEAKIFANQRS